MEAPSAELIEARAIQKCLREQIEEQEAYLSALRTRLHEQDQRVYALDMEHLRKRSLGLRKQLVARIRKQWEAEEAAKKEAASREEEHEDQSDSEDSWNRMEGDDDSSDDEATPNIELDYQLLEPHVEREDGFEVVLAAEEKREEEEDATGPSKNAKKEENAMVAGRLADNLKEMIRARLTKLQGLHD